MIIFSLGSSKRHPVHTAAHLIIYEFLTSLKDTGWHTAQFPWHTATKTHTATFFGNQVCDCYFLDTRWHTATKLHTAIFFEKYLIFYEFQKMLKDTQWHMVVTHSG